ncbi:glycerophosphodiester phosphodiesterase [Solibacillus ferritrahens]|uniref:glycerophosphodiester phosphodiesterase n=1 Tax=Solibacillus ferritrahens TaxID=3098620 RepID=UPI00300848F1
MNEIPVFAHRGASSLHLENTLSAFKKAKKLGADGIELDLQISKDGILVVFHDMDLKRLAGINRLVSQCDYKELVQYNLGPRFKRFFLRERMMSFEDVLKWAIKENIALNIELKESLISKENVLKTFLHKIKLPANSHFSSFHESLLKTVKEVLPKAETAIIITKKFDWTSLGKCDYIDAIHAHRKYYKMQYLEMCTAANIGIRFYGIRGNELYLKSPHQAVIGWITDFPHKVLEAQQRKKGV